MSFRRRKSTGRVILQPNFSGRIVTLDRLPDQPTATWCGDSELVLDGFRKSEVTLADDGSKLPIIRMNAYNGGPVTGKFIFPFVININGVSNQRQIPLLYKHDDEIGHSTSIRKGKSIDLRGILSVVSDNAQKVRDSSANGFPYQASVGIEIEEMLLVERSVNHTVNGRRLKGPLFVAEKSNLFESSVVPIGADQSTSTTVTQGNEMKKFFQWLQKEHDVTREAFLQLDEDEADALFEEFQKLSDNDPDDDEGGGTGKRKAAKKVKAKKTAARRQPKTRRRLSYDDEDDDSDPDVELELDNDDDDDRMTILFKRFERRISQSVQGRLDDFAQDLDDRTELAEIEELCVDHPEILKAAKKHGWDADKVRDKVALANIRSQRAHHLGIHVTDESTADSIRENLACRLSIGTGMDPERLVEGRHFEERVVEQASGNQYISLKELVVESLRLDGTTQFNAFTPWNTLLRHVQQNWSAIELPNMLESNCQRQLDESFRLERDNMASLFPQLPSNDFRPVDSFRLEGGESWQKTTPDGKLEHTSFGTEVFHRRSIDTYGQMIMLARKVWENDDLGAIQEMIEFMIEMGLALEDELIWEQLVLDIANFFSVGNSNLLTGANAVLGGNTGTDETSLKNAYDAMKKKKIGKGKDSKTITVPIAHLVVPCELDRPAWELLQQELKDDGSRQKNFWKGRMQATVSTSLTDAIAKYSKPIQWFLFTDKRQFAPLVMSYLRNIRRPTVESVQPMPGCLGAGFQMYWDIGANTKEPCGAHKNVHP